jgi:hypothetical protein
MTMSQSATVTPLGVPVSAPTEYVRRRGRPRRVAETDLRSVVVACRVDPPTAHALQDRAECYGLERATLLAQLVTTELSRPAPRRRRVPQPTVEVEKLTSGLDGLENARSELREVNGTLRQFLGSLRELGREDVVEAMLASLDQVDAAVLRVEELASRTEELIYQAEGRRNDDA